MTASHSYLVKFEGKEYTFNYDNSITPEDISDLLSKELKRDIFVSCKLTNIDKEVPRRTAFTEFFRREVPRTEIPAKFEVSAVTAQKPAFEEKPPVELSEDEKQAKIKTMQEFVQMLNWNHKLTGNLFTLDEIKQALENLNYDGDLCSQAFQHGIVPKPDYRPQEYNVIVNKFDDLPGEIRKRIKNAEMLVTYAKEKFGKKVDIPMAPEDGYTYQDIKNYLFTLNWNVMEFIKNLGLEVEYEAYAKEYPLEDDLGFDDIEGDVPYDSNQPSLFLDVNGNQGAEFSLD